MNTLDKPSINLARDADDKARKQNLDRTFLKLRAEQLNEAGQVDRKIDPVAEQPKEHQP